MIDKRNAAVSSMVEGWPYMFSLLLDENFVLWEVTERYNICLVSH
jgi:hypothetical protein